jgi:hypothetical protein
MARHRTGLKRWLDLKPGAHAGFSLLTRNSPRMARLLDFFPAFGRPERAVILHDDEIASPIAEPRYAEELAVLLQHNRETIREAPDIPPLRRLRRVVWEVPDIYIPGGILAAVDRGTGRIASLTEEGPTSWATTRPRPLRRAPIRVSGRTVLIPHMKHYGHLLHDELAPIAFAVHLGLISRERPVTMVCAKQDNPVTPIFAEGLVRLGVATRVLRIGHDEGVLSDSHVEGAALVASGEHTYAMPEATALLRRIFELGGGYAERPEGHSRVYLTRGNAKLRQMSSEAELIALLRERGFHVFESRWDNHEEQLALFSSFDTLVGVHGAGLVNAVFAKPSAQLIEIMASDARKTTGLYWAACAGMGYHSILGGPEGPRQSFAIDARAVARRIDALLA